MDCGARPAATLIRVLNAGDTEGVGLCMGEITERNQRDTYRGVKGGRGRLYVSVRGWPLAHLPHISADKNTPQRMRGLSSVNTQSSRFAFHLSTFKRELGQSEMETLDVTSRFLMLDMRWKALSVR